jgi:hypothetical protein
MPFFQASYKKRVALDCQSALKAYTCNPVAG